MPATTSQWFMVKGYTDGALERARILQSELLALQELIEALDRRVPHVERAGEAKIAADARQLRASATERMARLRGSTC